MEKLERCNRCGKTICPHVVDLLELRGMLGHDKPPIMRIEDNTNEGKGKAD